MTPILPILGVAFLALAIVWPLSYFGYKYYIGLVEAENEKHSKQGGH